MLLYIAFFHQFGVSHRSRAMKFADHDERHLHVQGDPRHAWISTFGSQLHLLIATLLEESYHEQLLSFPHLDP